MNCWRWIALVINSIRIYKWRHRITTNMMVSILIITCIQNKGNGRKNDYGCRNVDYMLQRQRLWPFTKSDRVSNLLQFFQITTLVIPNRLFLSLEKRYKRLGFRRWYCMVRIRATLFHKKTIEFVHYDTTQNIPYKRTAASVNNFSLRIRFYVD